MNQTSSGFTKLSSPSQLIARSQFGCVSTPNVLSLRNLTAPAQAAGTKKQPATMLNTVHKAANSKDIPDRVSYLSNASGVGKDEDGYQNVKTPDAEAIDGALRDGGAPNLLSKDCIGLLFQYATVGLVYGTLPATIYPFLQEYLNVTGNTYSAAAQLVDLPWSFKVFYGIVSDSFPIFGYRRRPYMIIGWTICFIMLLIMACTPVGDPYFPNEEIRNMDPEDYTAADKLQINYSAQDKGGKYIILMMLAAFGYLMADVCADGVVVEFAQREPEAIRGRTQSTIYGVRTAFVIIGQCLTGFAFNGEDYGGDFDFSLSFPALMAILAVCTIPVIPATWFFLKEEKYEAISFKKYIKDLWTLFQTRAVYQIVFYNFFSGIFANFSYTSSSLIQSYWAKVTPLNNTLSGVIGNAVFLAGIAITGKWGLHWNWRIMIVLTSFIMMVVDGACTFITIWDIFRSQWFWLGLPIAVYVPYGINFIVSTFVTVEIAKVGNEGAIYGLMTTVTNLSSPFATALTLAADNHFNMTNERMQHDDHSIRLDVTYSVILMYAMTVVSWGFIFFLPKQKAETQELVRTGGSSFLIGCITLFYLLFALVWAVMTNIMAIFPSTSCLVIAGGDGC